MGKRTRSQRKGKSKNFTTPSHRYSDREDYDESASGKVIDIVKDPSRSAPLAKVKMPNNDEKYILAPEGIQIGDEIDCGRSAPLESGNRLPVSEIPEGIPIYSIEKRPGDGAKFARSSGVHGLVKTHDKNKTVVELPSGNTINLNPECRATVGVVAGGGRKEKPYTKAGNKHKAMRAKGKKYPKVSAVAMNAVDHPFGGSADPGKPKTVKSSAPPGKKAGSFGAKSTGKKGKKK